MSKIYAFNNSLVQAGNNLLAGEPGGTGPTYIPGQYISIEDDVISVTGLQPEGDYATEADLQTVSAAIPDISNLATKTDVENVEADLQTVSAAIPDVAQADWAATGGPSEILNKPNFIGGENVTIAVSGDDVIINTTEMVSGMQVVAGEGVRLTVSGNYLIASADETVLADNIANEATSFTLSEKPSNFERIRLYSTKGLICEIAPSDTYMSWGYFWVDESNGVAMQRIYTATSSNGTSWQGGKVYGYNMFNSSTITGQYGSSGWYMETKKIVGINRKA